MDCWEELRKKLTVILNHDQWMNCWEEMHEKLGFWPSWDEYPDYFDCISCNSTDESGLEIVFKNEEDKVKFILKWA